MVLSCKTKIQSVTHTFILFLEEDKCLPNSHYFVVKQTFIRKETSDLQLRINTLLITYQPTAVENYLLVKKKWNHYMVGYVETIV